jgi:hypothetical protein
MLPLITSAETLTVMNWIAADEFRRASWVQRAESLKERGMERAVLDLASLLEHEVSREITWDDPLATALVQPTLTRINFFEIAVAFLAEVDDTEYFTRRTEDTEAFA